MLFLVWLLTVQAALAAPVPTAKNNSVEAQKFIELAVEKYNSFAINPSQVELPSKYLTDKNKIIKDYLRNNKIKGPLPKAELTKSGAFLLTLEGKSITVEIDPVLGLIRQNGNTLILKSTDTIKSQLEQMEKFLTPPTGDHSSPIIKTVNSLFSIFIPSANADCMGKYDAAIEEQTPKYKWYQKIPIEWSLGVIVLAGLFLPAAIADIIIATTAVTLVGLFVVGEVKADDIAAKYEEQEKKTAALKELVAIRGAIAVAKTGTLPPEASIIKRLYSEDELRFFNLYFKYSNIVKKVGGTPISKEEFLKALADGDSTENFCNPNVLDTAEKITEQITAPNPVDPNVVNQSTVPSAAVVDESRKDIPKALMDGVVDLPIEPVSGSTK